MLMSKQIIEKLADGGGVMHDALLGLDDREQNHAAAVLAGQMERHGGRFHRLATLVDRKQNGLEHAGDESCLVLAPRLPAGRGGKAVGPNANVRQHSQTVFPWRSGP